MHHRLEELTRRASDLERTARELRRQVKEIEEEGFVQCAFSGNTRTYCYALPDGYRARVGEYLVVYSPHTDRPELVRVMYLGRGTWKHGTKTAHPISWIRKDNEPLPGLFS